MIPLDPDITRIGPLWKCITHEERMNGKRYFIRFESMRGCENEQITAMLIYAKLFLQSAQKILSLSNPGLYFDSACASHGEVSQVSRYHAMLRYATLRYAIIEHTPTRRMIQNGVLDCTYRHISTAVVCTFKTHTAIKSSEDITPTPTPTPTTHVQPNANSKMYVERPEKVAVP
ncbi:hypothetical protein BHYA_0484g00020 [Botrytis hyacinthi]|uniref:Uncharacterized protein n=1 Tax=Botrytis hyacinthi TaxID=278943 RepID=A0A4Z1G3M7_9HELO|nr:hypothetical protein BHYA_0484g00020 [Botrytis hyacinthi]